MRENSKKGSYSKDTEKWVQWLIYRANLELDQLLN
jgi:hypothetical protein